MIPFQNPLIETCPHCKWQNNFIIKSDCIPALEKNCPKCREKTKLVELSTLEKFMHSIKKTPVF
ncbi:Uncharacterised protein [Canicola haemoglobinophilus]|uniref:Uncharacterized protein n=1 Tax=Canicola haemoglobinophilus TaxID=733 RepID=A0AB38HCS1_9PAST|nr:Uncharacterised protein [Canicola haemoglobinophilus]STO69342.1 Uncharacterised protein [Canicola haemoglobinophilus]